MAAIDFYSYKQLTKEQFVANLSFTRKAEQKYVVSLVDSTGKEINRELSGDLWQLDARILKWNTSLNRLGLMNGYRLDRLSGRYYSLEDEKNAERTVYQLSQSQTALDIWQWLRDTGAGLGLIDATYGSATYLPMEDGALFSVNLTQSGLIAKPLNARAKAIVASWE